MEIAHRNLLEKASISRLISVLYICHKFRFFRHAQWAKRTIFESIHSLPSGSTANSGEPPEALNLVLSSASEGDIAKLLQALAPCCLLECPTCEAITDEDVRAVWGVWLLRLQSDPSLSSRRAIDCAESLGLSLFLGRAYYTQLVIANARAMVQCNTPETTAFEDPELDLTVEQSLIMFKGYWSLSRFWDSVRCPPEGNTPDQASHDSECCDIWEEMWQEGVHGNGGSPYRWNPIGALLRLSLMENPMKNDEFGDDEDEAGWCGCFFREEARRMRHHLLGTLADHFTRSGMSSEVPTTLESFAIKVRDASTTPTPIPDRRPSRLKTAPATTSPRVQNAKHQDHKQKLKIQKRQKSQGVKRTAQNTNNGDQTTDISPEEGLESHNTSRSPNSSVVPPGQIRQVLRLDTPKVSRADEGSIPEDLADLEYPPSEAGQTSATTHTSRALQPDHAASRANDPINIEDTPSPPPLPAPPLDRAASPNYWGDSEGEPPTQNFLYFQGGANPAKIPKTMFDQHGKPIQNYPGIGEEDEEMIA